MTERFFHYQQDDRWKLLLLPLRLREHDGVTVTDDMVRATFGYVSVNTQRSNVIGASISGPHRWWTAVGLRLSFADDGLTFGTNHHRGVCIDFAEPVKRVIGFRKHSALWVSVADCEGLVEALTS